MKTRLAAPQDAEVLLEIYRPYVEKTAITFEYEVPTVEEFRERIQETLKKYPYVVLENENQICGYAYASTFKGRAAYDWCVETSIYIREDVRGEGYGRRLYEVLEQYLSLQNVKNVNACIAYTEVEDAHLTKGSVRFHEKMGYQMVGQFHQCGYKYEHWYDMVWMEKMIGEHEAHPGAWIPFSQLKNMEL
ncbi:MAG: GNAT family N-acetyltransferase [Eubacteriales bacterium]|nr:GNAT family N-acetyltransferase [Eubacteriales bacterium]